MVAEVAKGTERLNIRGLFPEEMEDLLLIWIKEREMAGDTLSQNAMCQKARQIYQNLKVKKDSGIKPEVDDDDSKGSKGRIGSFKNKTKIRNVVRPRNADFTDKFSSSR
ncbi:hypothetical protein TNCV_78881 [Trichonephila clavipes]|nr:hypothetical protein TNCV_78881 [Trichonephila clavipes]